jgi:phosphate transport system substrate-binding protein
MRFVLVALVVLALPALAACRATPTPPPKIHFSIGTADSTQYLAREIADAFRRAHPSTTFDFFTSNSTTALRQMPFENYDLTFIERNPRADELERAQATALELGRDGVFLVVHPNNPIPNLTRDQVKQIFSGGVNLWSQLGVNLPGGRDEIQVLVREDGSGMRAVIQEKIMQGARTTPTALLMPTNLDILAYVADHPNAIGYVAANIWDENSRTRPVALENIPATRASIAAGTYPLIQTVFLIAPQAPNEDVTLFLDFCASDDGRTVLYHRISELLP